MLFRSFTKSCPTADLRPPARDVALVLNSLTAAPYEPLKDTKERLLASAGQYLNTFVFKYICVFRTVFINTLTFMYLNTLMSI